MTAKGGSRLRATLHYVVAEAQRSAAPSGPWGAHRTLPGQPSDRPGMTSCPADRQGSPRGHPPRAHTR